MDYKLKLSPSGKLSSEPVTVALYSSHNGLFKPLLDDSQKTLLPAETYTLTLIRDGREQPWEHVKRIQCNNAQPLYVGSRDCSDRMISWNAGCMTLCPIDFWGSFSIEFSFSDAEPSKLSTAYLPLRSESDPKVRIMRDYLKENFRELLPAHLLNIQNPQEILKEYLKARIRLLQEAKQVYHDCFGFFKNRCKCRVVQRPVVSEISKIQSVTGAAISYLMQHPEELYRVPVEQGGLMIGDDCYRLRRAMGSQNVRSKDIYENRVVLGFLKTLCAEAKNIAESCPEDGEDNPKEIAENVQKELQRWYHQYCAILPIPHDFLSSMPHTSPILLNIAQYRSIYKLIVKWTGYQSREGHSGKEDGLLPYLYTPDLYERYVLAQMLDGMKVDRQETRFYPPVSEKWLYRQTECCNVFHFSYQDKECALYYQPVIYSEDPAGDRTDPFLPLRRLDYVLPGCAPQTDSAQYYTPDYLLQVGQNDFYILDAKYSTPQNIHDHQREELIYKYALSIVPKDGTKARNRAVYIFCGRDGECDEEERAISFRIQCFSPSPDSLKNPLLQILDSRDN